MSIEEFKSAIAEIQIRADKEKDKIAKEYVLANNTIKIGDVVKTNSKIGKVIKVNFSYYYGSIPTCVYLCEILKKDLTPKKNTTNENIWQDNVIEILVNGIFEKITF